MESIFGSVPFAHSINRNLMLFVVVVVVVVAERFLINQKLNFEIEVEMQVAPKLMKHSEEKKLTNFYRLEKELLPR